ncbi:MAG: hypothetical protein RMM17_04355 [Acidobacteriota bacterium]|nr:hypothetical protein [Blastocatellia bacterium]MDW8411894.1 hypothetical protein [Acidobacteriota bacterium]
MINREQEAEMLYQITCDDVRLEVGNKLSLMGIFQEIYVQRLPVVLPKLAVVTQWTGYGRFTSEIRILSPKHEIIAASAKAEFEIPEDGYANNINFFMNLHLERPGRYLVQTLLDGELFYERPLIVGTMPGPATEVEGRIN